MIEVEEEPVSNPLLSDANKVIVEVNIPRSVVKNWLSPRSPLQP
jgi:hypothetical protein